MFFFFNIFFKSPQHSEIKINVKHTRMPRKMFYIESLQYALFIKLRENQKISKILNGIMNYSHTIKRQSLK